MRPIVRSDGRDLARLIDEPAPSAAALIDDVVAVLEDAVRQPVVAHELPDVFDRFNSGDLGGRNVKVMLSGTFSFGVTCQPAWSRMSTACALGPTALLIAVRCSCIASVSQ